ncbi:hypothetical protein H4R19_000884 [Coemansia spiralis]|nr:hypothetical protein H4R19_000884 [Coemansia spiralis]
MAPATTRSSKHRSTKKNKGKLAHIDDDLATVKEYFDRGLLATIDPGVSDVFYAAGVNGDHVSFTASELETIMRTEHNQRILDRVKAEHPEVLAAEEELSKHDSSTTDADELVAELKCWGKHRKTLNNFYGHDGPKTQPGDVEPGDTEGVGQPIFLKFKLDASIDRQRRDAYIAKNLFDVFGDKKTGEFPLLVMEDWAGRHVQPNLPISSSELYKVLVAQGFKVLLISKNLTSKKCDQGKDAALSMLAIIKSLI